MTRPASVFTLVAAALVPLAALLYAGGAQAQQGPVTGGSSPVQLAQAGPELVGSETCLACHDEAPVNLILFTPHAQSADGRTPFGHDGCETCHGSGGNHAADPENVPIGVRFEPGETPAVEQNKVCLGCHQGGMRINWQASPHASANRTCAGCHTVHAKKDKVLVKASQPEVCFGCHREQRAQSMKRSHHPIREGKVVCADCHNPHGSFGPKQLKKDTVNETCFQCHAEKRGPFLWEHAPVVDSCVNCHTPHGSAQPRLLKARTPMLCQQCHSETFHPSTIYSGEQLPPPIGTISNSSARILAKGCMNCHPQVHGTNHPSGPRLTR